MTSNSKIQELYRIHILHQNVCERQKKELKKISQMFKSNREIFIENWINKYYDEEANDECGNIDYLTAEAEREFYYTIQYDVDASEMHSSDLFIN